MTEVKLYTIPGCGFCSRARRLLSSKGAAFSEIDLGGDYDARQELVAKTGHQTFPQVFIGDRFVGGSDELAALERSGRLDALLF